MRVISTYRECNCIIQICTKPRCTAIQSVKYCGIGGQKNVTKMKEEGKKKKYMCDYTRIVRNSDEPIEKHL